MSDDAWKRLEFLYRTALDTRNLEIGLFWQRSNYFLVLNTAIAVGFFSRDRHDWYTVALSLVGIIVALLWVRVNLGSKYWQVRWERRLEIIEREFDAGARMFGVGRPVRDAEVRAGLELDDEKNWIARRYKNAVLKKPSVSSAMTSLSAFFVVLWAVAAVVSCVQAAGGADPGKSQQPEPKAVRAFSG